jgi:hypothetical protein
MLMSVRQLQVRARMEALALTLMEDLLAAVNLDTLEPIAHKT